MFAGHWRGAATGKEDVVTLVVGDWWFVIRRVRFTHRIKTTTIDYSEGFG
jgi:hypothetical protein